MDKGRNTEIGHFLETTAEEGKKGSKNWRNARSFCLPGGPNRQDQKNDGLKKVELLWVGEGSGTKRGKKTKFLSRQHLITGGAQGEGRETRKPRRSSQATR